MTGNKKVYLRLFAMLCITFGTQIIMILKSSRVAALFGAGVEMDAYNYLSNLTGFIFTFISSSVGVLLLPSMVRGDGERARNGFLTILYGAALAVIGMLFLLREPALRLFGGYSEKFIDMCSSLFGTVALYQLLLSLMNVPAAYLQSQNCLVKPKVWEMVVMVITTVVIYLATDISIYAYSLLTCAMTFSQMVAKQTMSVRRGFHYRPCIPLRDPELKTLFCNFIPTAVGAGVYQLTVMTDSVISSGLGEGNVSILSYAGTISAMVNSAIAGNILLYIYPKIAAEINGQQGKHKLFQYMLLFAMLMCGVVVLFVAAGYDAVRILFERGAFGPDATGRVFICVLIYLLGSPINIMRDVVYRYFYARGNTKSTFYNGVSASTLNMVVSIILARFMGLYGVVLGTTVTSVFSFTSILIRMKKQYTFGGNFPFFAREMSKVAGAMVLAICGCMLIKAISLPWPSLAVSVLAAVAGVLVFGVVLLAARSKVLQVELG